MATESVFKLDGEQEIDGMVVSKNIYPENVLKIKDKFSFGSQDVLIASYPRSGNTWLSEALYLIHSEGDFEPAKNIPLPERVFYLEQLDNLNKVQQRQVNQMPSVIKSHLPASYFQRQIEREQAKTIIVYRNPKDCLVSLYKFYKTNPAFNFKGTQEEFFDIWKARRLVFGDWLEWNLSYWELRHVPNVLIISYEDAQRDILSVLRNMASFLGKSISDALFEQIKQHISFDEMQSGKVVYNREIKNFIRRGKVGEWQNVLTPEQIAGIDKAYSNWIEKAGLPVQYTL